MRNKYAGSCYRCGKLVSPGQGHFERDQGGWKVQHADCAIAARLKAQKLRRREAIKNIENQE